MIDPDIIFELDLIRLVTVATKNVGRTVDCCLFSELISIFLEVQFLAQVMIKPRKVLLNQKHSDIIILLTKA